jgi:hypothetical protein
MLWKRVRLTSPNDRARGSANKVAHEHEAGTATTQMRNERTQPAAICRTYSTDTSLPAYFFAAV